jgi:hypothetical protein
MSDPLFDSFKLNINLYKGISGEPLKEPEQVVDIDMKRHMDKVLGE